MVKRALQVEGTAKVWRQYCKGHIWGMTCLVELKKASVHIASLQGGASNGQVENKMPAVPFSEAKVSTGKNPDAIDTQKTAQAQHHSHASNLMSSSSSRELITQPGKGGVSATQPTQTEPQRWDHYHLFKKVTIETTEMLGLMLSGKLSPWKRKRESPQISVESLPRTVNIFGSPQRTNAFWRLAGSAVLEREWLQADWWWPVGATFSGWHLRQAGGSLEWEQIATSLGWWKGAKISQKTQSKIRTTGLCLFFFFFLIFYLFIIFIFGCVGSSFLCEGFL